MLQATMQERRLHFGNVVAMGRAAFGDDVLSYLSLQYMLQFDSIIWSSMFIG